jgi:V/A-type H+-transporting ATPase subunit F
MVKMAVMGDAESIKGFAAVGLDIYPCEQGEDAAALLRRLVNAEYGVIYITEQLAAGLEKDIQKLDEQLTPSVVPLPGVSGNNGVGRTWLKQAVEKAVGSDIIFNKD